MTSISRNVHTDKYVVNKYNNNIAGNIVNKYNNKHYRTTKRKPIDIKTSTYFGFGVENNNKDPKFKVGDPVKISKYQNSFAKGYTWKWSQEVYVIEKLLYHGHM